MTHLSKRMLSSNDDTQRSNMKQAFSENLFEQCVWPIGGSGESRGLRKEI